MLRVEVGIQGKSFHITNVCLECLHILIATLEFSDQFLYFTLAQYKIIINFTNLFKLVPKYPRKLPSTLWYKCLAKECLKIPKSIINFKEFLNLSIEIRFLNN